MEMFHYLTQGEKNEIIVPKPGEFVVITSDQKIDKTKLFDVTLPELLDVILKIYL